MEIKMSENELSTSITEINSNIAVVAIRNGIEQEAVEGDESVCSDTNSDSEETEKYMSQSGELSEPEKGGVIEYCVECREVCGFEGAFQC